MFHNFIIHWNRATIMRGAEGYDKGVSTKWKLGLKSFSFWNETVKGWLEDNSFGIDKVVQGIRYFMDKNFLCSCMDGGEELFVWRVKYIDMNWISFVFWWYSFVTIRYERKNTYGWNYTLLVSIYWYEHFKVFWNALQYSCWVMYWRWLWWTCWLFSLPYYLTAILAGRDTG